MKENFDPIAARNGNMNHAMPHKDRRNGLWHKCTACEEPIFKQVLERNFYICPRCNFYSPMPAAIRLRALFDSDSLVEVCPRLMDESLLDALELTAIVNRTDLPDLAHRLIAAGEGTISNCPAIIAVIHPYAYPQWAHFVTLLVAIRMARLKKRPLIAIYPGDALPKRQSDKPMQSELSSAETMYLTVEMDRLSQVGLPLITVLTDPDPELGFSTRFPLGDLVLAERNRIVEKASHTRTNSHRRVKPSYNPTTPAHVIIDHYVQRQDLPEVLGKLLAFFNKM